VVVRVGSARRDRAAGTPVLQADRALCGFVADPMPASDVGKLGTTPAVRRGWYGGSTRLGTAQSTSPATMCRRRLLRAVSVQRQLQRLGLEVYSATTSTRRQLLLRLMQKLAACF